MKVKSIVFGSCALVALCIALPIYLQYRSERELAARIEADYQEFKASGDTTLSTSYPELLQRVLDDPEVANRVTGVFLTGANFDHQDYSALRQFPNLKRVEVAYSSGNMRSLIETFNKCPQLQSVDLYYCKLTVSELKVLDSETLERFSAHDFTASIPESSIEPVRKRMPNCAIGVFGDDE